MINWRVIPIAVLLTLAQTVLLIVMNDWLGDWVGVSETDRNLNMGISIRLYLYCFLLTAFACNVLFLWREWRGVFYLWLIPVLCALILVLTGYWLDQRTIWLMVSSIVGILIPPLAMRALKSRPR